MEFQVTRLDSEVNSGRAVLSIAAARPDPFDNFRKGCVVASINGMRIGSPQLDSLEKVLSQLTQGVEVMMEGSTQGACFYRVLVSGTRLFAFGYSS